MTKLTYPMKVRPRTSSISTHRENLQREIYRSYRHVLALDLGINDIPKTISRTASRIFLSSAAGDVRTDLMRGREKVLVIPSWTVPAEEMAERKAIRLLYGAVRAGCMEIGTRDGPDRRCPFSLVFWLEAAESGLIVDCGAPRCRKGK